MSWAFRFSLILNDCGVHLKRNDTVYSESVISEQENTSTDFSGAVPGLITAFVPAF